MLDPNRIDQRIRLGAAEEWTITNLDEADHPFHIHTDPFMVTRVMQMIEVYRPAERLLDGRLREQTLAATTRTRADGRCRWT